MPLHIEPTSQSQPTPVTDPTIDPDSSQKHSQSLQNSSHKLRKLSSGASAADSPEDKPPPGTRSCLSKDLTVFKDSVSPAAAATAKNRRSSSQSARVLPSVIKPLSADGEIDLALHHLCTADLLLVQLIALLPPMFDSHQPLFLALTKSIMFQQLAHKVGTSIYARFVELCGGKEGVCPDAMLALLTQQLQQIGVSARKAMYLFDLANKTRILSNNLIVGMDDKSIFTLLSMVKGIGSWSVHMFMIFSLHKPDVLLVSDMGVRKGVQLRMA